MNTNRVLALLAMAACLLASLAALASPWTQRSVSNGPGLIWDQQTNKSAQYSGLNNISPLGIRQCDYRSFAGSGAPTTDAAFGYPISLTIPTYINFGDTPGGNPWTVAEETYFLSWISNICATPWWQETVNFIPFTQVSTMSPATAMTPLSSMCFNVVQTAHNNTPPLTPNCSVFSMIFNLGSDFNPAACSGSASTIGSDWPVDYCIGICSGRGGHDTVPSSIQYPGGPSKDVSLDTLIRFVTVEMDNLMGAYTRYQPFGFFCGNLPGEGCGAPGNPFYAMPNGGYGAITWTSDAGVGYGSILSTPWLPIGGGGCWWNNPTPGWWIVPCKTNADCPAWSGVCDLGVGHCVDPGCGDGVKNQYEVLPDYPCGLNNVDAGFPCTTFHDCNEYPQLSSAFIFNCLNTDGGFMSGTCQPEPPQTGADGAFVYGTCPDASLCPQSTFTGANTGLCMQRQTCTTLADCVDYFARYCQGDGSDRVYTQCDAGYCFP